VGDLAKKAPTAMKQQTQEPQHLSGHKEGPTSVTTMVNGRTQTEPREHNQQPARGSSPTGETQTEPEAEVEEDRDAVVPLVRVCLLRVPPRQSVFAKITITYPSCV
jgi:hypothetical protein